MSPPHDFPDDALPVSTAFCTTHWSVVWTASAGELESARRALEQLCRVYWYPLYAYTRRRGYRAEDAQDLTQAFFARLIEKNYIQQADRRRGKFRTFLLSSFSHFLADEWDRSKRLKRGGAAAFIELDALAAEDRYKHEPVDGWDAEKLYHRRWATTLLEKALKRLEQESCSKATPFTELSRFLLGDQGESTYTETAPQIGMTPAAMKMAVSRLRTRCRELIREEISQTVCSPEDGEDEFQGLMAALRR